MSQILLIDAEQPFADEMVSALSGEGFTVHQVEDGKEGLEYARAEAPALIVLCVELPKMSGYSICNKLKKDAELKQIPLIITSKEATPETFEQHKKLKTRAEDYLIKPFDQSALMAKIGNLVELPAAADDSDPLDALDALDALDDLGGDIDLDDNFGAELDDNFSEELDDLDGGEEEDLLAQFDSLGEDSDDLGDEDTSALGVLDSHEALSAAELNLEDELGNVEAEFDSAFDDVSAAPKKVATGSIQSVNSENIAALNSLRSENADLKAKVAEAEANLRAAKNTAQSAKSELNESQSSSSSSARDVLNLKEKLRSKDKEIESLKDEIFDHEKKVVEQREEIDQVKADAKGAQEELSHKDAEIASLSTKTQELERVNAANERDTKERLEAAEEQTQALASQLETQQSEFEEKSERMREELEQAKNDVAATEKQLMNAYARVKKEEDMRAKAKQGLEVALAILNGDVSD